MSPNGFFPYRKALLFFLFLAISADATVVAAQNFPLQIPVIDGIRAAQNGQEGSLSLFLILMVALLSLAPALIMMVTSFTKIAIVLDFVRRALALHNLPPNQVLFGLAIFLSVFIMAPTFKEFNEQALQPYLNGEQNATSFLGAAMNPFRNFMIRQIGTEGGQEISLFTNLAGKQREEISSLEDIDSYILIPAFMLSEIKKAFIIGIVIFIPFVVVDFVVASTLMSMGMFMLPPALISLPFKLILFILVDGWNLISYNLVKSYGNP